MNEAALIATRRSADAVSLADFTAAVERIVAGFEKRNRLLNPFERRVVAYHEMGHALVALKLPGVDTVHKVSIIPRGVGALGYTIRAFNKAREVLLRQRRALDIGAGQLRQKETLNEDELKELAGKARESGTPVLAPQLKRTA